VKHLSLEVESYVDEGDLSYFIETIRQGKRNLKIKFTNLDNFKEKLELQMKAKNYTNYTLKEIIHTLT
jgi:hypothetical protein